MISLKSNIVLENNDMKDLLAEVDRFTETQSLTKKERIRIRLLTKEAVGVLKATVKEGKGELKIESTENEYVISFAIDTPCISDDSKEKLIETSSGNKNEFYQGFTGKIRQAIEWLTNTDKYTAANAAPAGYSMGFIDTSRGTQWSYQQFKKDITTDNKDNWDELERSVLSKLANEILVGVSEHTVSLKVFYRTGK